VTSSRSSAPLADAPTRKECERGRDALYARPRGLGQTPAAACLERDWQDFVTFYDLSEEHWVHLRTSNPIESIFSGVRLRTNASKRLRVREKRVLSPVKCVKAGWVAIVAVVVVVPSHVITRSRSPAAAPPPDSRVSPATRR
jgi:hypothetical protein